MQLKFSNIRLPIHVHAWFLNKNKRIIDFKNIEKLFSKIVYFQVAFMARVTKTASIQEFHPQSRTDEEESQQE